MPSMRERGHRASMTARADVNNEVAAALDRKIRAFVVSVSFSLTV
jgi:hypothetical protein